MATEKRTRWWTLLLMPFSLREMQRHSRFVARKDRMAGEKRKFSWWRLLLQVFLALVTLGLVAAIMLPAYMAPKSAAPDIRNRSR
jgi:hypothetical protein